MGAARVFGTVLMLGVALTGQAPPISAAKNNAVPKTVRGCVIGGDGGYVLRDSNGEEWRLLPTLSPIPGDKGGAPKSFALPGPGDKGGAPGGFLKPYIGNEIVVGGDAGAAVRTLQHAQVQEVIGSCMAEPNLMYEPEG